MSKTHFSGPLTIGKEGDANYGKIYVGGDDDDLRVEFGDGDVSLLTDGTFNVKAYGATGDGVTDDTAAIQAAIDAAEVNGGLVYFPVSTYIVTGITVSVGGISLRGDGDSSVLSCLTSGTTPIITVSADFVSIFDLKLIGNRVADGADAAGISISGSTGSVVSGATVLDAGSSGIAFGSGVVDSLAIGCRVEASGLSGIQFYGSASNSRAIGNYVLNSNYDGNDGSAGIAVLGTTSGLSGISVASNVVSGGASNCIRVSAAGGDNPLNCVVSGNVCEFAGWGGDTPPVGAESAVAAEGMAITASGCSISGNTVRNSGVTGILIFGDSSNIVVSNNIVSNSSQIVGANHAAIQVRDNDEDMYAIAITGNIGFDDQGSPTQSIVLSVTGDGSGSITGLSVVGNVGNNNIDSRVVNWSPSSLKTVVALSANVADGVEEFEEVSSFSDGDATPSVRNHSFWQVLNSSTTTIASLDDGSAGQDVVIKFLNGNTTIEDASTGAGNISLDGSVDFNFLSGAVLQLKFDGTSWLEMSRTRT